MNVDQVGTELPIQSPSPISTVSEVRTNKVYITSRSVTPKYYTQSDIDRNYVDSLVKSLVDTLCANIIVPVMEREKEYALSTQHKAKVKAIAYLSVPISAFLWLFLLLIGSKLENARLILVSLILLICSIVGTFIVSPTIILGLGLL